VARASTDLAGRCALTNRYRGAAMAEFWRALETLKALQAEQAVDLGPALAAQAVELHPKAPVVRPPLVHRPRPDEPERGRETRPERRLEYVLPGLPKPSRTLHEPAAPWLPNEPAPGRDRHQAPVLCRPQEAAPRSAPNEPGIP
jgi:hypothetical protein